MLKFQRCRLLFEGIVGKLNFEYNGTFKTYRQNGLWCVIMRNNVKRQIANVASSLFRITLCHCFAPTLVVNPVPKVVGSEMQHMPLQQKTPPQTCGIRQA